MSELSISSKLLALTISFCLNGTFPFNLREIVRSDNSMPRKFRLRPHFLCDSPQQLLIIKRHYSHLFRSIILNILIIALHNVLVNLEIQNS